MMFPKVLVALMLVLALAMQSTAALALNRDGPTHCGERGVWLQVLGSGGTELLDERAMPSYLIWHNGKARLLVNTAPGSSYNFNRAQARLQDLEAIVFTNLLPESATELPAFMRAGLDSDRRERLFVLGPDGNAGHPGLETLVQRLVGRDGAFPQLADMLQPATDVPFRISLREVPASGNRRWAQFRSEHFQIAAIPVHHGAVPALAWRIELDGKVITIAGSFNNQKNLMPEFAKGSDILVVHHALPESARGQDRDYHLIPSQIGRLARDAEVRSVALAHRSSRTRGIETITQANISEHYSGYVMFANDLQCWGL